MLVQPPHRATVMDGRRDARALTRLSGDNMPQDGEFPAALEIDYPDRDLDRLTTFFRLFTFIPIGIVLALLSGPMSPGTQANEPAASGDAVILVLGSGGVVFLPTVLMLLFRRKYPRWWFDWNLELTRFTTRCFAYLALLRDEYPSTDEEQAVHVEIQYPDAAGELNRYLPLVKWFLAIPHYVVLFFLGVAAVVCVIVAWLAILLTGRYPRSLFEFVVGVFRWSLRVQAYAFLLTTDRYPPFSLERGDARSAYS
jgi:hypothetical protein